ncbi:hypothetical protein ASD05_19545 [Variovorax sp. Root434]|nr:hypothetical protein ASD05_19545 [Variovorax sp. Root434]
MSGFLFHTVFFEGLFFGLFLGVRAQATGYSPPRMSPAFGSSFISLRGAPDALCNDCSIQRSRRWGALRSEIKEEAAGRGTFAEQGTPSA